MARVRSSSRSFLFFFASVPLLLLPFSLSPPSPQRHLHVRSSAPILLSSSGTIKNPNPPPLYRLYQRTRHQVHHCPPRLPLKHQMLVARPRKNPVQGFKVNPKPPQTLFKPFDELKPFQSNVQISLLLHSGFDFLHDLLCGGAGGDEGACFAGWFEGACFLWSWS